MSANSFAMQGYFTLETWDHGLLIAKSVFHNGITIEGINDLFDEYLDGGTGLTFYLGLIDNTNFDELLEADTMASHTGWQEITAYDEATRPAWGPDAASGKSKSNSTKAVITASSAINVRGSFLASDSVKGGTTGVLWSTGLGDVIHQVQPAQQLKLDYTIQGQEGT